MATDRSPTEFDAVDWNEVAETSGRDFSPNFIGTAVAVGTLLVLVLYDYLVVSDDAATFAAVGWNYNVTGLDWLFAFSLILFAFYGLLPLYQNARMTRYYWTEFRKNRPAVLSLVFLGIVFVGGLLGPLLIPAPETQLFRKYQPPVGTEVARNYVINCVGPIVDGACQGTWEYPLGTTQNGRDIFTMIVYGMQITLKITFIATLIVITLGTAVGTVSAYMGGMVDEVLMRYVDIQASFPVFIFYLLILYIFGGGLALFIILFGLFAWEGTARYVRSNALAKTEEEYIKAVKLSGASTYHVIRRHIVPNTASSIITNMTLLIPAFILFEAQLAFLGLGDSEVPSWGQLIAAGRSDLSFAPWITLAPGFVLFLTILAFNFLGDALLDALDPETQAESES
jgi:peptide/nickel transport system permease protein